MRYSKGPRQHCLLLPVIVIAVCALSIYAQRPTAHFVTGKSSVNIPVDIDNNLIRMKVRVNGSRPLVMIFDTAAAITTLHPRIVKELGVTIGERVDGIGTGGAFQANMAGKVKLSVEGVEVSEQPLMALAIDPPPGFDFDGIIGYDFIRAFVVDIDYQKKTVSLHDPAAYRYRGRGVTVPLDLRGRKTPLINVLLTFPRRGAVRGRVELDTGGDSAMVLNAPYVKRHRLAPRADNAAEHTGRGAGGEEQRVLTEATAISFAGISLRKVPVFLSLEKDYTDADAATDGILGGEVLRRFRVIIDYSRSRVILERNTSFYDPFDIEG